MLFSRDGSTVDVVMEQLYASLNEAPPSARPSSLGSDTGAARAGSSTRDALLLALRGVSLAGEGIRTEDAGSFRKVSERDPQILQAQFWNIQWFSSTISTRNQCAIS